MLDLLRFVITHIFHIATFYNFLVVSGQCFAFVSVEVKLCKLKRNKGSNCYAYYNIKINNEKFHHLQPSLLCTYINFNQTPWLTSNLAPLKLYLMDNSSLAYAPKKVISQQRLYLFVEDSLFTNSLTQYPLLVCKFFVIFPHIPLASL